MWPAALPALDIDPFDADVLVAPDEYHRALRELGPIVYLPRYGACAIGRIDLVESVFRDWRRFPSARGVGLSDFKRESPWRPPSLVLEVDPPQHDRTRRVLARALSPSALEALDIRFARDADDLVLRALARQHIDAVAELAAAFPLKAFGDAVGLLDTERSMLLRYGTLVFNALGPDNALRRGSMASAPEVVSWIAARCQRPALSDDGFGAAIHAAAEAGDITVSEAELLVRSLLSAGIDTTVATLANGLYCFALYPQEWQKLKADAELIPAAIDEVLRYSSPVHTFCRTTDDEVEIAGTVLPEGTKILCVMAAANRDPRRWAEPDVFNITRERLPHVAFGSGIHVCVGQHVARREIAALLGALRRRVARLTLTGRATWLAGNAVRTLASLPLRLEAG